MIILLSVENHFCVKFKLPVLGILYFAIRREEKLPWLVNSHCLRYRAFTAKKEVCIERTNLGIFVKK